MKHKHIMELMAKPYMVHFMQQVLEVIKVGLISWKKCKSDATIQKATFLLISTLSCPFFLSIKIQRTTYKKIKGLKSNKKLECGLMKYESSRALCRSPITSIEVHIHKYINLINLFVTTSMSRGHIFGYAGNKLGMSLFLTNKM